MAMSSSRHEFPVLLTQAQRKAVALLLPALADRLKLDEKNQRAIPLSLAEMKEIAKKAPVAVRQSSSGMVRNSLRCLTDIAIQALDRSQGIGSISVAERLYQFKISLVGIQPAIWRRIQVRDCTLDKLHEYIQTAIDWTNSHLHRFQVGDDGYADPMLMEEDMQEFGYIDSTGTKVSEILPKSGKRFRFEYEYDFGDGWQHEIVFEGCLRAEPGSRYPVCVEGARACPPEDVGGAPGYDEYLKAMADPEHERHEEFMGWRGPFDPEAFDPVNTTKKMKRGLPDWRRVK